MLTDDQLAAMEPAAPMLVSEVRRLQRELAVWTGPTCPNQECPDYDDYHPYHENQVEGLWRKVDACMRRESNDIPSVRAMADELHTLKLQLHDNQTLRDDYEKLVKENAHRDKVVQECRQAVEAYKEAALRDEETIKELKLKSERQLKSETFREVRDERDAARASAARETDRAIRMMRERDEALKKVELLQGTVKRQRDKLAAIKTILAQLGVPASEKLFDVATIMRDVAEVIKDD